MRKALPEMAKTGYGRVVNVASVHGLVASVNKAPYVSAKFGLVGLSRVAALEYAALGSCDGGGITVNCICPGWTETAIIEPQIAARAAEIGGSRDDAISSLLAEKQPSRRTSRPEEIGALVLWLAHPTAHNITGAAIPIDGAWTAQLLSSCLPLALLGLRLESAATSAPGWISWPGVLNILQAQHLGGLRAHAPAERRVVDERLAVGRDHLLELGGPRLELAGKAALENL